MSTKSRTEYSLLNIMTGVGGYIISVLLSLVNRMVFTRTLPIAYLGVGGLFTNVLSMLSLAELGVGNAIVYALYKPLAEKDEKKVASLVRIFRNAYATIGIVILALGVALTPLLPLIIGSQPDIHESIYLIYFIFLISTVSSYFFTYRSSLLVAAQQNYIVTGINYSVLSIQEIVQAVYLFYTHNYIGYLVIRFIGNLIVYVWTSQVVVKKFPYITDKTVQPLGKNEKKQIFANVRDLMIYKISGVLVNGTDNIITTFFDGLSITGLASNYTLLTNTLNALFSQVFNGITASVGNLNAIESEEKKYSLFKMTNLMNFWLYSWGTIGIIFVSTDLVKLLFGESYELAVNIPIVLAINFYTVGMQNSIWVFKHTMGLFKYGRFTQTGTAVLNLLFSVLLGYKLGLFGILLATFLARLLTNLWYDPYIMYKKAFKRNPLEYLVKYAMFLLIFTFEAIVCWSLCQFILGFSLLSILCKMLICSLIPNVVFVVVFKNTEEFKYVKTATQALFGKLLKMTKAVSG